MDEISLCNMKVFFHSDKPSENNFPSAVLTVGFTPHNFTVLVKVHESEPC